MEKKTINRADRSLHALERKYGVEPKKTEEDIEDEWKWR